MIFWEIREPASSDYRHVQVSGKLDHPYRLPTAKCEKCGESIGEFDAVLPLDCPASLRRNPLLTDKESEVPIQEFRRLAKKLVAEAGEPGVKAAKPVPGACLQPGFLDVPSLPNVDFLWSNLWSGLSSMVVSERVRRALADLHTPDTVFYPVTFRHVGKRSAKAAPRIPPSGEPEDMMRAFEAAKQVSGIGAYYQLLVMAESNYPPGAEPRTVCSVCGEEQDPDWDAKDAAWERLTSDVLAAVSKRYHIFKIPERGTIFVTQTCKELIERLGATNVEFREFPAPKATARTKRRGAGGK